MLKTTKDEKLRGWLRLCQYEHRIFQKAERRAYYHRRDMAVENPYAFTSMIIDGMQQATTTIPSKKFYDYPEKTVSQKLTGVLVHGRNE